MQRRQFAGLAAAGLASAYAQTRKLRLGIIGCGWWGGINARAAMKHGGVEFTALCDVDSKHLDEMAASLEKEQGLRPKTFKQYKDLLAMDALDGVILATPPHWHALPFIAACERKLPVYCEKPLAYDPREGRAMARAAAKAGNIVQVGFQRRQSDAFRAAREFIASGQAGRIVQADVNIHYTAQPLDNKPQDPPSTLDWDLWCGPAPKLPYSPNIGHRAWRLEETTGNGHLVDWGIHLIDATRTVLNLGVPLKVTAVGGIYEYKGRITTPDTLTAHFEFAELPVVWRHRLWGAVEYLPETSNGVTFFGEKATVFATDNRWVVIPKEKGAQRQVNEIKGMADMGQRHVGEWLDAVRSNQQPSCGVEDAWKSTTTVQLGMIAYKAGRTIHFDAKTEQVTNDPAANKSLLRAYRAPWKHPYV
jgi:predicted dehydrogenase